MKFKKGDIAIATKEVSGCARTWIIRGKAYKVLKTKPHEWNSKICIKDEQGERDWYREYDFKKMKELSAFDQKVLSTIKTLGRKKSPATVSDLCDFVYGAEWLANKKSRICIIGHSVKRIRARHGDRIQARKVVRDIWGYWWK